MVVLRHTFSSRAQYLGLALLGATGIALLIVFDPKNTGMFPTCPFLSLTGCYCPGCGTLRALRALLLGDVVSALGYNVLAMLSLPFIAYSYGAGVMRAFGLRAPRPAFVHPYLIWALLLAIVAYWITRNLPFVPLNVLAP